MRVYRVAACLSLMWLMGCAQVVTSPAEGEDTNVQAKFLDDQLSRAQTYLKQGDLHNARMVLRSILVLNRSHAQAKAKLRQLETEIAEASNVLLAQGERQLKRGERRQAQTSFQKVLAMDPGNSAAREALQSIAAAKVRQQADDKSTNEIEVRRQRSTGVTQDVLASLREKFESGAYLGVVEESSQYPQGGENGEFSHLVASALVILGDQAMQGGNFEEALAYFEMGRSLSLEEGEEGEQGELSASLAAGFAKAQTSIGRRYFAQGLRLIRTNPAEAVVAFKASLEHDPGNAAAKGQLARAKKMQEKLERLAKP
ncbi:MAG: hypothetical protein AAF541_21970 [Pseudomonadota bacterium]